MMRVLNSRLRAAAFLVLAAAALVLALPAAARAETCAILYANGDFVVQEGAAPDAARGKTAYVYEGLDDTNFSEDAPAPWAIRALRVKRVVFEGGSPASIAHWFDSGAAGAYSELAAADLSGLSGSTLADASWAFRGCPLGRADLSGLALPALKDASHMFEAASKLSSADLSGMSAPALETAESMFAYSSVASADLSGMSAASLSSMSRMFEGCGSLRSLSLAGMSAPSLADVSWMLSRSGVESADLRGLPFGRVRDATGMLAMCNRRAACDVRGWDTSSLERADLMFAETGLKAVPAGLASWDVSSLSSCRRMFEGCDSLERADLSGWAPSRLKRAEGMFHWCRSLKSVTLGRRFGRIPPRMLAGLSGDGCVLVVQSKKLTKKRVAKCARRWRKMELSIWDGAPLGWNDDICFFKAPKIRAVKVQVGSKKANRRYAKKYRKLFTKKTCGAKLKVVASKKALRK